MSTFWWNFCVKCLWPKIVISDILCEIIPRIFQTWTMGKTSFSRSVSIGIIQTWTFKLTTTTASRTKISSSKIIVWTTTRKAVSSGSQGCKTFTFAFAISNTKTVLIFIKSRTFLKTTSASAPWNVINVGIITNSGSFKDEFYLLHLSNLFITSLNLKFYSSLNFYAKNFRQWGYQIYWR